MQTQINILEYKDGIWRYNPNPISSVFPIIESRDEGSILKFIGLYPDKDNLYFYNNGTRTFVSLDVWNTNFTLESEIGKRFAIRKLRIRGITDEKVFEEIASISNLEKKLLTELPNYRIGGYND